ncbi:MAG: hypothetical protein WCP69_14660 [Bacteroidota bacterium]
MKSLKLFGIGIVLFITSATQAQVSVNVNIGTPPQWGPMGYNDARYYYLPDIEAYYDVPSAMFIYYDNGAWIRRPYLSARYRNYDLYSGYKVVLPNYRGANPYYFYNNHRSKYAKGYRGSPQRTYGNNPRNGNFKPNTHFNGSSNKRGNFENHKNKGNQGSGNGNRGEKNKGGGKGKR